MRPRVVKQDGGQHDRQMPKINISIFQDDILIDISTAFLSNGIDYIRQSKGVNAYSFNNIKSKMATKMSDVNFNLPFLDCLLSSCGTFGVKCYLLVSKKLYRLY